MKYKADFIGQRVLCPKTYKYVPLDDKAKQKMELVKGGRLNDNMDDPEEEPLESI